MNLENNSEIHRIKVAIFINSHADIFKKNLRYMNLSLYDIIVVSPISYEELKEILQLNFHHIHVPPGQDFDRNFLSLCEFAKDMEDSSWIVPLADDDIILNFQTVNGERLSDFSEELRKSEKRGSRFVLFEHAEYFTDSLGKNMVMRESAQFLQRDREVIRINSMTSPYLIAFPRFCGIAYQAKLLKTLEIANFVGTLHAYAAPMYLGVMNDLWGEFIPSPRFAYYAPEDKSWSWTNRTRIYLGVMHFASLSISLGYDEKAFSGWPQRFHILLNSQHR